MYLYPNTDKNRNSHSLIISCYEKNPSAYPGTHFMQPECYWHPGGRKRLWALWIFKFTNSAANDFLKRWYHYHR